MQSLSTLISKSTMLSEKAKHFFQENADSMPEEWREKLRTTLLKEQTIDHNNSAKFFNLLTSTLRSMRFENAEKKEQQTLEDLENLIDNI